MDVEKSRVGCDVAIGPYLLIMYKHEDDEEKEDAEVISVDEIETRVRFSSM